MLALDWMFRTYPQPATVAVMGWSAGALASPLYTHIVAPTLSERVGHPLRRRQWRLSPEREACPPLQILGNGKLPEARRRLQGSADRRPYHRGPLNSRSRAPSRHRLPPVKRTKRRRAGHVHADDREKRPDISARLDKEHACIGNSVHSMWRSVQPASFPTSTPPRPARR